MANYFDRYDEQISQPVQSNYFDRYDPIPDREDDRTIPARLNDFVIDTANAVAGLAKAGVSLFAPESGAAKTLGDFIAEGQANQSDQRQHLRRKLEQDVATAKAEGDTGTLAYVQHMLSNPVTSFLPEALGNFGPFAAIGRGAQALGAGRAAAQGLGAAEQAAAGTSAALGATATTGGLVGAGGVREGYYNKIMGATEQQLSESPEYQALRQSMGHDEAKQQLATQVDPGLATGMLAGGGISALSGRIGAERALFGGNPGFTRTMAAEIGGEFAEGATQQAAQNLAVRSQIPSQSLTEDVLLSGTQEALMAAPGGAIAGAVGRGRDEIERPPTAGEIVSEIGRAETVDEVIAVASAVTDETLATPYVKAEEIDALVADVSSPSGEGGRGSEVRPAVDGGVGEPLAELPTQGAQRAAVEGYPAQATQPGTGNEALDAEAIQGVTPVSATATNDGRADAHPMVAPEVSTGTESPIPSPIPKLSQAPAPAVVPDQVPPSSSQSTDVSNGKRQEEALPTGQEVGWKRVPATGSGTAKAMAEIKPGMIVRQGDNYGTVLEPTKSMPPGYIRVRWEKDRRSGTVYPQFAAGLEYQVARLYQPAPLKHADTPRIASLRQRAEAINANLPPVKEGYTRMWRGSRADEASHEAGTAFTHDLIGIAMPFKDFYKGRLSYVDVPTQDLAKYVQKGGSAPDAEFLIPQKIALKAKEVSEERREPPTTLAKASDQDIKNLVLEAGHADRTIPDSVLAGNPKTADTGAKGRSSDTGGETPGTAASGGPGVRFSRKTLPLDENDNAIAYEGDDVRITVNKPGSASYVVLWAKQTVKGKEYWRKVGVLDTNEKTKTVGGKRGDYLGISSIEIEKPYRGRGLGKKMYQTLLEQAAPNIQGIISYLPNRVNKTQVPSIYKSLGAFADGDNQVIPRSTGSQAKGDTPTGGVGVEAPKFSRAPPTESPPFRKWFGKSAVVDKAGKPLVVYHGTRSDIESFRGPVWVSEQQYLADVYSRGKAAIQRKPTYMAGSNVMPVYASVSNPFEVKQAHRRWVTPSELLGDLATDSLRAIKENKEAYQWINDPAVLEVIKAAGHDGVLMYENGARSWLAFEPTQIKSSIGNQGTYDPTNPDIRFKRDNTEKTESAPARVAAEVERIKAKWKNAPEVEVLATFKDAPPEVRDYDAASEAEGAPEGFIFRGKVYLVADQIKSEADTRRILFHESLGHLGMRGVLGDRLDSVLDQIAVGRTAEVKAKAKQYGLDFNNLTERRIASEEVLANLAETRPELSIVQKAIAIIRKFMRDIGFDVKLTDAEIIREVILPARNFIERGAGRVDSGGTGFSRAIQTGTEAFKKWFGKSKVVDADGKPMVVYHGTYADIEQFKKTKGAHLGFHFGDVEAANSRLEDTADKRIDQEEVKRLEKLSEARYNELAAYREQLRRKDSEVPREEIVAALEKGDDDFLQLLDKYKYQPTAEEQAELKRLDDAYQASRLPIFKHGQGANIGQFYLSIEKPLRMRDVGNWGSPKTVREALPWHSNASSLGQIQNEIRQRGFDGIVYQNTVENPVMRTDSYIAFEPTQIKSATGNRGTFDPSNPDIRYSLAPAKIQQEIEDFFASQKGFNWFHRTLGTQYHKAKVNAHFRKTFEAVQRHISHVNTYANEASDLIPTIFPKIEKLRDIAKPRASKKDMAAAAKALFEGTLADPDPAKGKVWTPAELKSKYGMTDAQVTLYQQTRAAIDKSLDDLGKAEMAKEAGTMQQQLMAAPTVMDALAILSKAGLNADTMTAVEERAKRIDALKKGGYAPLMRFGRYSVYATDAQGNTNFQLFDRERDANKAARELKEQGATVKQGVLSQETYELFAGISPDTLEVFADAANIPKNAATQAFLKMARNQRSASKRLIHRKGTEGYSEDLSRVLASFITSNARRRFS